MYQQSIPFIRYPHLPLTMPAGIVRSIFNKGAGAMDIPGDTLIPGLAGLSFAGGLKIFKWY